MNISLKSGLYAVAAFIGLIVLFWCFGINDAGHRTVVQYPNGTLVVKFDPGIYFQGFGAVEEYVDVVTFDFDQKESADPNAAEASLKTTGIKVLYQDGGNGFAFGKARFALPTDEQIMIHLHKDFRSNEAVTNKLIKTVTEESINLTAGLMTSEEAYAEKRGIFTQWAEDQVNSGKYVTEIKQVTQKEVGTGERVERNVPVIKYDQAGVPLHLRSDFKMYGISVSGFQITHWDFEQKTLDQIARKREATMGIITAKADAERARQEALTAEEQGKKDVMVSRYTKEQDKVQAVVDAEKAKEVAVLAAQQKVLVAEQGKLEAEQKRLAAVAYKQEQILRGEGDGEYKRIVMQADGALSQKLEAFIAVNAVYAKEFGKQKWVPELQMGSTAGSANPATDLISLLVTKTAKDLSLDTGLKKQ
jgi:regulator of protease activity HflC (stomatin/prohibitin superfamily)